MKKIYDTSRLKRGELFLDTRKASIAFEVDDIGGIDTDIEEAYIICFFFESVKLRIEGGIHT